MWQRSFHALLDVVLPPTCPACSGPGGERSARGLCRACCGRLPAPAARCPCCGRACGPHRPGDGCVRCTGAAAVCDALSWTTARRAVRSVIVGHSYTGAARDLVLALKFRRRLGAASLLAPAMIEALLWAGIPGDVLVPVPLSRARRRRRGFNQALVLARLLSSALSVPLDTRVLRRRRHDPPQSRRSRSERRRSPRGAFVARPPGLGGRCVILVDDVLTTGATAKACALALRRAGAASVSVVVACRTEAA